MKTCRVELLGGLRVWIGDRMTDRFRTRKAACLLARLALKPDRAHPREELMDLFWPDMEIEAARTNLRQALSSIRRLLDAGTSEQFLSTDNTYVRLAPGIISTDVEEFEAAMESASIGDAEAWAAATELYRGELMAGFYDDWIFPERRRLESMYLNALHGLQVAHARAGEPGRAIPYALRAIQVEPYNEEYHLALMRLHAACGDCGSIARQFDELKSLLGDELGVSPSSETVSAVETLLKEASSNETVVEQRTVTNAPRTRLVWKRALMSTPACLALAAFVVAPVLHEQRSGASNRRESAEDRLQGEMRQLRFASQEATDPARRLAARKRHAELCLVLAEKAWGCWYGREEEAWLHRFTEADEDVRMALRWLLDHDPEQALRLSGDLTRFWYVRGFSREGYRWLSDCVSRAPASRTVARARALVGAAFLSPIYGAKAEWQCREALAIFRECHDGWGEAHAIRHLGFLACSRARFTEAASYYDRALARFTQLKDEPGRAVTLLCMSFVTRVDRDRSLRKAYARRSLDIFSSLGNPWGLSMALHSAGQLEEDPARAKALISQAISAYPEANGLSEKEYNERACLAGINGDLPDVRANLVRELQLARDRNNRMGVAFGLEALIALPATDKARAIRLLGATRALNDQLGIVNGPRLDRIGRGWLAQLGQNRFDVIRHEGEHWSWERAVDEAAALN